MNAKYYFSRVRKANQVHWPIADNVQNIVIPYYMTRYIGNNIDEKCLICKNSINIIETTFHVKSSSL